ncbi:MAG: hypothetical protein ACPGN3_05175 [Opitutales bacterium]
MSDNPSPTRREEDPLIMSLLRFCGELKTMLRTAASAKDVLEKIDGYTLPQSKSHELLRYINRATLDERDRTNVRCEKPKEIVGIWDFRFVPYSFGEYIQFCILLRTIQSEYGGLPVKVIWFVQEGQEMRFDHYGLEKLPTIQDLLKISDIFEPIENVELITSLDCLENRITELSENARIVPRIESENGGVYAHYIHWYRYVQNVYLVGKHLPRIIPKERIVSRLRNVLQRNGVPDTFVAIHLRANKYDSSRNVALDKWLPFAQYVSERVPALVVVGASAEDYPEIYRENVYFTKSFDETGPDIDFPLITLSKLFIGTASGPSVMAYFNDVPCLMADHALMHEAPYVSRDNVYPWNNDKQVFLWKPTAFHEMQDAFNDIMSKIEGDHK